MKFNICTSKRKSPPENNEFLDALPSLDSKLPVSESVIDVFRLAHLRVFQSYLMTNHIMQSKFCHIWSKTSMHLVSNIFQHFSSHNSKSTEEDWEFWERSFWFELSNLAAGESAF